MDAAIVMAQNEPAREVIRDNRGIVIGTIERPRQTGKAIARDRHGIIVGVYEERLRTTRDAHGRLVGRANLLPALLFQRR